MCDQHTDALCPFKFTRSPAAGIESMDHHVEEHLWHCECACQLYMPDGRCAFAVIAQALEGRPKTGSAQ